MAMLDTSLFWKLIIDTHSDCCSLCSIPPRTCLSLYLWHSFKDMQNVKPARDRPVLVAFRGTPSGTGMLHGARLQCNRTENWHETVPGRRLHPDGPVLATIWDTVGHVGDYDYVENAIFCPQPAGITGEGSYTLAIFCSNHMNAIGCNRLVSELGKFCLCRMYSCPDRRSFSLPFLRRDRLGQDIRTGRYQRPFPSRRSTSVKVHSR